MTFCCRLILPRFHRHPAKRVISTPEESYENEQTRNRIQQTQSQYPAI